MIWKTNGGKAVGEDGYRGNGIVVETRGTVMAWEYPTAAWDFGSLAGYVFTRASG